MKTIYICPECGNDLVDVMVATNPPIQRKQCFNCGWNWEDERDEVVRIPFDPKMGRLLAEFKKI